MVTTHHDRRPYLYTFHSHDKCMTYPAFVPLFLLMEVGLIGAMLTGDLFTFFVFMELDGAGFGFADGDFGRSIWLGGGAQIYLDQLYGHAVSAAWHRRAVCHIRHLEHGGNRRRRCLPASGPFWRRRRRLCCFAPFCSKARFSPFTFGSRTFTQQRLRRSAPCFRRSSSRSAYTASFAW